MALATNAQPIALRTGLAPVALALALFAGIVGGLVGGIVSAVASPAPAAGEQPGVVVVDPNWVEYGHAWEQRYRQMYPERPA
jgi:hypothetical protein